jgi:hypothetical protein
LIFFQRIFLSIFFFYSPFFIFKVFVVGYRLCSGKKKETKICLRRAHPNAFRLAKSPMLRWRFYARLKALGPELRHNGVALTNSLKIKNGE